MHRWQPERAATSATVADHAPSHLLLSRAKRSEADWHRTFACVRDSAIACSAWALRRTAQVRAGDGSRANLALGSPYGGLQLAAHVSAGLLCTQACPSLLFHFQGAVRTGSHLPFVIRAIFIMPVEGVWCVAKHAAPDVAGLTREESGPVNETIFFSLAKSSRNRSLIG